MIEYYTLCAKRYLKRMLSNAHKSWNSLHHKTQFSTFIVFKTFSPSPDPRDVSSINYRCVSWCFLKLLEWLKRFPHCVQPYGLSPVWWRRWKRAGSGKTLPPSPPKRTFSLVSAAVTRVTSSSCPSVGSEINQANTAFRCEQGGH